MSRRFALGGMLLAGVLVALSWLPGRSAAVQERGSSGRLYEHRVYTCHPGKLDDLHRRFRNHTNYLFVKHGMTLIGFWTPRDREDTLSYILAYPNREAREKSWKAFLNDPAWKKAYEESRRDGPIVMKVQSTFMSPTDYSPLQ